MTRNEKNSLVYLIAQGIALVLALIVGALLGGWWGVGQDDRPYAYALYRQALVQWRAGHTDSALAAVDTVLRLGEFYALDAHALRSLILAARGDWDDAEAAMLQGLRHRDGWERMATQLSHALADESDARAHAVATARVELQERASVQDSATLIEQVLLALLAAHCADTRDAWELAAAAEARRGVPSEADDPLVVVALGRTWKLLENTEATSASQQTSGALVPSLAIRASRKF